MHIVLVYRCYNDGTVCYNLTFCTEKSLMTDLGSMKKLTTPLPFGEGLGERPSFLDIPFHRTYYLK